MGAAGLIQIKRRMKSIESTRKITKAMNLVATSKLRKTRKEFVGNEDYYNISRKILSNVIASLPDDIENSLLKKNPKSLDKKLYIVLTSDTGFCGGFNGNVANALSEIIEDKSKAKVLIAGSKGIQYMKKLGIETFKEYVEIPDIPTIKEVRAIYDDSLYLYKTGEVSEVHIVYTEFKSAIVQKVTVEKILPLDIEVKEEKNIIIEQDINELLNSSIDSYIKSKIRRAMLSSKVSEQNSRMKAMDSSTQNANDIIKVLAMKYNRIRQGMITQEISEIVGGAEAQK